ncbi:MAG TPA: cyclodeaminase/cyclohydrolase family protein [Candidatus Dormibacteraeota bacterium]|nr:cyclodeaminase/cyclohydrolase family protein [Candidatus Dormibacteraeota bacterium]
MRLSALLDGLASDRSVPASGSASAAVIAIASSLLEKVARLATAHWASADAALEQAHALRLRAEELVEADANAYMAYVEARRSAKGMSEKEREQATAPARAATVDVPLAIARLGAETVALAAALAENGNPNLRADAMVAATLAAAAATSAARLIAVNLSGASDDRSAEADRLARAAGEQAAALGSSGVH